MSGPATGSARPVLEALELAIGFPDREVARGIGFSVSAGEVLCVLGPNGGGKTTLFRTLLGLLPARGGSVRLGEARLDGLARAEVARHAGYVPQGHAGYFAYTVRELVTMGRTAHLGAFASPGAADRRVAERAMASLGIASLAERAVTEISGGERQLALIARALAQEPSVLVMDEPTASLDFGNQVRVLERIRALAAGGIAIVFSSHDPDHAFLAASRVLLLGEGRMLALGEPREVIRPPVLRALYGVEVNVVEVQAGRFACLPALGSP